MHEKKWRRANFGLLLAIILINGYVILIPVFPIATYWWQQHYGHTQQHLSQRLQAPPEQTVSTPKDTTFHSGPNTDGLIIPKMLLDTPLVEGPMRDSFNLLNKGAWHLPISSTPAQRGNTVIAGHRFSYTGPRGVFYYLDKLSLGDDIGLWYHGTLYRYTVQSTRTVASTEVRVEQPTADTRLTLYTCTPLWNPVSRLVVVATPTKGAS